MSTGRASIATQEVNLLRMKWELAEEYLNTANNELKDSNFGASLKLCDKAMELYPDYFPAIQLKKKITDVQKSFELRMVSEGSTQAPKRFERDTKHKSESVPKEGNGCLRPVSSMKFQPLRKLKSDAHENAPPLVYQEDRQLSEGRLKNLLLEGYYHFICPIKLFVRLRNLWHPQSKSYCCPSKGCKMESMRRLNVVDHFIEFHFSGNKVLPFGCRTCKERYKSAAKLLKHGYQEHPTCHWPNELRDAISADD